MKRVPVGKIVGAHGIRGGLKVRSFTENPCDLFSFVEFCDEEGKGFLFSSPRMLREPDLFICKEANIRTREEALGCCGALLLVDRALMKELGPGEFYYADLIGVPVERPDGLLVGTVVAVHNFGAGDVLEIQSEGSSFFVGLRDSEIRDGEKKDISSVATQKRIVLRQNP